jgi:Outer membrane protein beta-barrel domain
MENFMVRSSIVSTACVLVGCSLAPEAATAQERERTRISGSVFATGGDIGTTVGVGASAGFRFDRHFGIELEGMYLDETGVDDVEIPRILGLPSSLIFPPIRIRISRQAVLFTSNVVAEFPTRGRRLLPYVLAGGGAASVERRLEVRPDPRLLANSIVGQATDLLLRVPDSTYREGGVALNAGAGLDVRIWEALWVAGDFRYVHLFTNDDLDIVRFGTRISYRF